MYIQVKVFSQNNFKIFATTRSGGLMLKVNEEVGCPPVYLSKKDTFAFLNNPHQLWGLVEETWGKEEQKNVVVLKAFTPFLNL